MTDQKLMSTCLRLPEDVRSIGAKLGNGNLTEGVTKSVRFMNAIQENPQIEITDGMIEAVISLSAFILELKKIDAGIVADLQGKIRELEAKLVSFKS